LLPASESGRTMMKDLDRLASIVASLSEHMEVLRQCGFDETRQLLACAKLDLQMRIHGVTDDELRALCELLDRRQAPATHGNVIVFARPGEAGQSSR
jgi:hypothetical protein